MKKVIKSFLGAFALLFALTASTSAQQFMTAQQVSESHAFFAAQGRSAPEAINTAFFYGDGVWFHSNGSFRLHSEVQERVQNLTNTPLYNAVLLITGDPLLASMAGMAEIGGFLSPQEREEAQSQPRAESGNYSALTWFQSPFRVYNSGEGGGGPFEDPI
jgi:hypothetical protein